MKRIWIEGDAYEALKNGELFLETKGEVPIQVAPVDVVYFAENILGIKLLDYQKKILRGMSKIDKDAKVVYGRNGRMYIAEPKEKGEDE
ncbi:MAG: hypothetical protein KH921_07135 [Erysipelotrichaceae bacterium]|nr:hypothetical protein [Erysipelotrichaceae bacterium]